MPKGWCMDHKSHRICTMRRGFYILYAVFFIVSVGMICTFYLRNSYETENTTSSIHAKIQLELYAQSLKSMVLLCLKKRDFATCKHQNFVFPPNYHFQSNLTRLNPHIVFLDIHGFTKHPASTNTFRTSKRFVLSTAQNP